MNACDNRFCIFSFISPCVFGTHGHGKRDHHEVAECFLNSLPAYLPLSPLFFESILANSVLGGLCHGDRCKSNWCPKRVNVSNFGRKHVWIILKKLENALFCFTKVAGWAVTWIVLWTKERTPFYMWDKQLIFLSADRLVQFVAIRESRFWFPMFCLA